MRRILVANSAIVFIGSLAGLAPSVLAQVHENWVQTYDVTTTAFHSVQATAVAPSGNVYAAANYESASQATEPLLLKYGSDGSLLWSQTYTTSLGTLYGIGVDPNDESAYVFGVKPHATPNDSDAGLVLKYDSHGNLLWSHLFQFQAAFPNDAALFAVGRIAPNGDLVLGASNPRGFVVVRYDPSGTLVWDTFVPGIEYPSEIEFDAFGDIIVPAVVGENPHQFGVVKFSGAGALQWVRVVTGGGVGDEYAESAITDRTGAIYAVGWLQDPVTGRNGALVKLDSQGNVLWTRLNHGTGPSTLNVLLAVGFSPTGDVRVGGKVNNAVTRVDIRVIEYTESGDLVWQSDWDDGSGGDDTLAGMRSRPDGSLTALATTTHPQAYVEVGVIEWDSRGELKFGASGPMHVPGYDYRPTFGPDGVIVFAGATAGAGSNPKTLVAYEREQALAFCFGDGSNGACPCGNQAPLGHGNGCVNSIGAAARLTSSGAPLLASDTLTLNSGGENASAASVFLQGSAATVPVAFGDGLLCIGQNLKRLYVHAAQGGAASAPQPGELSISAQSAALGDTIASGATRYYQVYYRDDAATFCPPPAGSTWNVSSGLAVTWY
jgi:hypothetical protein